MTHRFPMVFTFRRWHAWLGAFVAFLIGAPALGATLNYFEWSAVAPIVVAATSMGENGRYLEVKVWRVMRGEVQEGDVLLVDLKHANRNRRRSVDPRALRLDAANRYLLLLEAGPLHGKPPRTTYRLVRGVRGARDLPLESAEGMVDVLQRFIEIHDLRNDLLTWEQLGLLLEETNPILIATALEQFLKFGRGQPELTLTLLPLLDHPEPEIRTGAAGVIGQILKHHGGDRAPEAQTLRATLIGRARRDSEVAVRVAATEALDGFEYEQVREILEEIAAGDPDQSVRYVAEKILLEHRQRAGTSGAAGNPVRQVEPFAN